MSLHFYKAKVTKIDRETSDCVRISFEIPAENREKFKYKAGQYLNLKLNLNGEEIRRSYSLCSSPFEADLSVAVKKIPHGKFSSYANGIMKVDDEIDFKSIETDKDNNSTEHFGKGYFRTKVTKL